MQGVVAAVGGDCGLSLVVFGVGYFVDDRAGGYGGDWCAFVEHVG